MERERGYFNQGLSFDELVKMSPDELEALRQRETRAYIENAPERIRNRLRGLQFQIDAKRKTHRSALGSCIAISQMMQESLERLRAALEGEPLPPQAPTAQVIPFPKLNQNSRDRPAG
jgi:hypothetical protein